MTPRVPAVAAALLLLVMPAHAQYRGPRSADYLLTATALGARALWVNPAGQGVVYEGSLMVEGMVERDSTGSYALAQYTAGFNSRGFGFGFRHDRFVNGAGGNTWRFGYGRSVGGLAVGAAVSIYSGADKKQDLDIGLRVRILKSLDLAASVEHIGQPTVRDSSLRFAGTLGLGWRLIGGAVQLAADVHAVNPLDSASVLLAYRAGIRIQTRGSVPFGLLAILDLNDELKIDRVIAGLSVGLPYQAVLTGSGSSRTGDTRIETVSLTGIVSKAFR